VTKTIKPYSHYGAWTSIHTFYYECAYKTYHEYKKCIQHLDEREKELRKDNCDMEPQYLCSYISHETQELWDEAYRAATSVHLFICMTIEAFVNHYGVKRLGEVFYKKNVERVGITEKISILILSCHQKLLDKDDQTIKKIRTLFDGRNSLVHPKTKEIVFEKLKDFVSKHPKVLAVKEILNDMEEILLKLCEMDNDINHKIEFKKPNYYVDQL